MSAAENLIRSEGLIVARGVVSLVLEENGGLLPLLESLGTAHAVGLEQGLALALLHPELGRQLLEAITTEGYPGAPIEAVRAQRAEWLIRAVEALNQ